MIKFLSILAAGAILSSCGAQVAVPAYSVSTSLTPFGPSVTLAVGAHTDTFGSPASSPSPSK